MDRIREVFSYLFFGALTTIVNLAVYYILANPFQVDYRISTIIAWVLAVVFAYITNKLFVFNSKAAGARGIMKEMGSFFLFRLLSLLIDITGMILLVELVKVDDFLSKLITNIAVIIFNYIASKRYIFKHVREK
ncbi:GtrA family protein [Neobacillus notoginsengisoli]|uniref:GtrA family protein n=1 Tax=Neobacillus notoginsengisoli TaxID=1578198 RepID=A0A417YRJ8_9BACI|nr:GtrA family protein [Neobacillus notoginsengisoli]RHW37258.1 GtrA family protein [Neobacillus notoginsengisoli]